MADSDPLEIRLLGELEVHRGGEPVALPASKKTRALLGRLVLARRPLTRARLCDLLWEGPADPRAALRWSLAKLRPVVDGTEPRLVADRERVAFEPRGAEIDLALVRAALGSGPRAAGTEALERCVARFRGELLEGLELPDCFEHHQWLLGEREAARNLHVQALAELTRRYAAEPERALAWARRWVSIDPLDEAGHAALIGALAGAGRAAEARAALDACTGLLQRELGRPPGRSVLAALGRVPVSAAEDRVPSAAAPRAPLVTPRAGEAGVFGRAEECAALERALDRVEGGEPAPLLLLAGEPGIGKSRLLGELLERAERRGWRGLYGRAYEAELARPYGVWTEALGELLEGGAAPTARAALFDTVARRLEHVAGDGPLVVALDDLQWVDEASAALLSWLARRAPARTLFAAAARPGEVADNPAARRLLRTLDREQELVRLTLGPLDARETEALARAFDPDAASDRIFDASGGNPLYAIELARGGGGSSEATLRAALEARVERLASRERELLSVAAALGRGFRLDVLADCAGVPISELFGAVSELEARGLLRARGEERYDFSHDLVREAAYRRMSEPSRRLVHRRVATSIRARADALDELAPDLARHAALAGEHALAVEAAVAAGERALRLFASDEAAALAGAGLHHVAHLEPTARVRAHVDLLAIVVHAARGRRQRDAHTRTLSALAEEARALELHDAASRALYLLSVLDEESGDFGSAEERTLGALAAGRAADPGARLRALANTGRCLAQLERELPRAAELLDEAAERADELGCELVDVPWGLGLIASQRGDAKEAKRQLEHGLALARARGEHWAAFECLARRMLVDVQTGAPDAVLARAPELDELAARLGGGSEAAVARAIVALAGYARDDVGAAEGLEVALAALRAQDTKAVLSTLLNAAATLDAARGAPDRARARAGEALKLAQAVGRQGQVTRARALIEPRDPEGDPGCRP